MFFNNILNELDGDSIYGLTPELKGLFLYKNLTISAKNTTVAAKFNKNLPIMSYISVAQYASI